MNKKILMMGASVLMLSAIGTTYAFAQEETIVEDDIIVTGTRRTARSAADSPAPVDVISGDEFINQGATDMGDLIRQTVPSYNVNQQPISDAATLIRPANLRGLSPDETLVLVNSKRLHRAAVITFLGGGISDGSQGPDISTIPALALKRVEVLRDGASSQYGSDAIAGVINFILKDDTDGLTVETKFASNYDNGGDIFAVAANYGMALGDNGFFNITGEYSQQDPTSQSVQRDDAAALIAAGNTAVQNAVDFIQTDNAQIWGQPRVRDDVKVFVNTGVDFGENGQLYAFGNYAQRKVEGGFFFRNPTNRGGVFRGPLVDPITGQPDPNGVPSVRVGDLSGDTAGDCPAGIPLTSGGGLIPDPTILAQIIGDPNCFSFVEMFPGGFTPRFGGNLTDRSVAIGVKGDLQIGSGIGYDISYKYGQNDINFFINNTINASLGPDTPTSFNPGGYTQAENDINADFNYAVPVSGFASDLNIAAGFEWRSESFTIRSGDAASTALGPLSAPSPAFPTGQGFSSSSNGFGGFINSSAGTSTQSNIAFYLDTEADVTERLVLQAAVRYENFDSFQSTTDYKFGANFEVTDSFRVRGTYSTGFHIPTAGQANVTNVSTVFVGAELADQGTIPLSSAAGQFMADFLVSQGQNRPTLGPEKSDSFSAGAALKIGPASFTLDFFHIKVKDRIALSSSFNFVGALQSVATTNGVAFDPTASTSQLINTLDAAGVLNAGDFAGSEDLTSFGFFNNDFDTRTQGIDIVGNMPIDLGRGSTTATLAVNYTDTKVTRPGNISPGRLRQLEENLPAWRGNLTLNHDEGSWAALVRANYYGSFFEDHLDSNLAFPINGGAEITFDAQLALRFNDEKYQIAIGANNILNNYPDKNPFSGIVGAKYPLTAPMGINGGLYYIRLTAKFP
jgi:iron complex outermembrane recepter protein